MTRHIPTVEVSRFRGGPNHVACNLVDADSADRGLNFTDKQSGQNTDRIRDDFVLLWFGTVDAYQHFFIVQCDFESVDSTASFDKKIFTGRWGVLCLSDSDTAHRFANLFCLRLPERRAISAGETVRSAQSERKWCWWQNRGKPLQANCIACLLPINSSEV